MIPDDKTTPIYWHERGQIMRFSQGEARPLSLPEADKLLVFYRREGPKADRHARDYMARCFHELHAAMGALHRSAA